MADVLKQSMRNTPVAELKAHPENPNRGRLDLIEESIQTNGFYGAVLAQAGTGFVLAGHHRLEAARAQGLKRVPTIWVEVDDATARRILVGDNRIGRLGFDDDTDLLALLRRIADESDGLSGTGYDDSFLKTLRASVDDKPDTLDEDVAPEPPRDPITKPDDVWILGKHRLVCGNAANMNAYQQLVGNDLRVDLVVTDPPYGVDLNNFATADLARAARKRTDGLLIPSDDLSDDEFAGMLMDAFQHCLTYAKKGAPIYTFHPPGANTHIFQAAFMAAGWEWKQTLIFAKDRFALGRQDYQGQHEPIIYGWKPGAGHKWYGGFDKSTLQTLDEFDPAKASKAELRVFAESLIAQAQTTLLDARKPHKSVLHPTMKPVRLLGRMLANSSRAGDVVLDPFAGSGSIAIAAEQMERSAFMLELSPAYCDVIVERWSGISGGKPKRAKR